MKITMLDPIPIDDGPVAKFQHHIDEGHRVRVKQTGHRGKLKSISANNHYHVMLDSGHFIDCLRDEIEPEDFPPARTQAPEVSRVQKAHAPLSFLDDPDAEDRDLRKALESAPIANRDGLRRALGSDRMSITDRGLIKTAIENIEASRVIVDPLDLFGETEEHNARILRIMCEKYASAGGTFTKGNGSFVDGLLRAIEGNTIDPTDRATVIAELDGFRKGYSTSRAALERLAAKYSGRLEKRMRPGLRVGMKVRGILGSEIGKVGTIESIDGPLVKVRLDDGSGESATLLNATMETLIPVEA